MNKTEILAAAQAEGIPLGVHRLNRYIRLGLLPSHLQGNGYSASVQADYPDAMTNIRFIEETRKNTRLGHYKNLLPLLFWKGYNVNTKKLQLYMMDYQEDLQKALQQIQRRTEDPVERSWLLDDTIQDPNVRTARSPGRPSTNEQLKRIMEDQQLRLFVQQLLTWIEQWMRKDRVQAHEVVATLSFGQMDDIDPSHPFLQLLQSFIDGFRWLQPDEAIDWMQVASVVAAMHQYGAEMDELASNLISTTLTDIPEHLTTHPQVAPFLLLLILVSHQVPQLHELLTSPLLPIMITEMKTKQEGGMHDASNSTPY